MSGDIFLLLMQDGLTTGAIYVLLALGLLLVFSVTRVIFIPQGDFVAYGTLSFAALLAHRIPGTLWLLDGMALLSAAGFPAARSAISAGAGSRCGSVRRRR